MRALIFQGLGKKALEERPKPTIATPTDAVVKITKTTICGTDLHILKGDVPTCQPGRVLGHEGVGVIEAVGPAVAAFKPGDTCSFRASARVGNASTAERGCTRTVLTADGFSATPSMGHRPSMRAFPTLTRAYRISDDADEEALVMLSDILPTGFECGVLNGKVQPGSTVAIVGGRSASQLC
jgi:alcohol dehydrogenase